MKRPVVALLAAPIAIYLLANAWSLGQTFAHCDKQTKELLAAAQHIDRGSRLLIVGDKSKFHRGNICFRSQNYRHLFLFLILERSVFMPTLFTSGQPVGPSRQNSGIDTEIGNPVNPSWFVAAQDGGPPEWFRAVLNDGKPQFWYNWEDKFDYVLWYQFVEPIEPDIDSLLPVAEGKFFKIFRVEPLQTD